LCSLLKTGEGGRGRAEILRLHSIALLMTEASSLLERQKRKRSTRGLRGNTCGGKGGRGGWLLMQVRKKKGKRKEFST